MMEEKKIATVVFTDLSEFTSLCEKLDPEEVRDILFKIFSIIEENTLRYKGKLIKIIGDCALCVFGIPTSLENTAENALKSVYSSYQTIKEISRDFPFPVKLHTGIHTGEVLYEIDEKGKIEILGDTVNTASRLLSLAKGDEILVSKEAYLRTKHLFDFEFCGKTKLKGKETEIEIYKLQKQKEKREKLRGLEEINIPLIGREKEINLILNSFKLFSKEKKDFLVLIKGEPGIGKTRLFEEFKRIKEKEIIFLEGKSLPDEMSPFQPVKMILDQLIKIFGENVFEKIFPEDKAGFIPVSPFLNSIIKNEISEEIKNLSPKEFKRQKFFVIESILRKLTCLSPISLLFEDLHWADEETFDFLKFLLTSMESDKGIFFILLTRPPVKEKKLIEFLNFLKGVQNITLIELSPLDSIKSLELIDRILSIAKMPEEIKKKIILEKSGGNPFYIEELTKYLIEKGIIYREGESWKARVIVKEIERLPISIEEILLSRIDFLDEKEKKFLKIASVIGSNFIIEGIKKITDDEPEKYIDALLYSGFITKSNRKFLVFEEYSFKHHLIHDSVYRTLLKKEKKHYHLLYAKWLEDLYQKNYDVPEGIIADHFEKGEEDEKSFIYNKIYAEKCKKNHINFEAIKRYKKLLEIIDKTNKFEKEKIEIYKNLGRLYNIVGDFANSTMNLRNALEISKEEEKSEIFYEIADTYQRASLYTEALFYLENAYNLCNKKETLANILREKAWINFLVGNFEECKKYLDKTIKIIEEIEDEEKKDSMKASFYNILASYFSQKGDIDKAIYFYKKSMDIYEKRNNIVGKGTVYNNLGFHLYKDGKIEEGIEMLFKSLEIEKNTGNYLGYAITCNNLGEMYLLLYNLKESEKFFKKYLEVNKKIRNRLGDGYGNLGMAEIRKREGNFKEAENFYLESVKILKEVKSEVVENRAKMCLSNFYLSQGYLEKSKLLLDEVLKYAEREKHFLALYSVYLLLANYHLEIYKKTKNTKSINEAEEFIKKGEELLRDLIREKIAPIELYKTEISYYSLKNEFEIVKEKEEKLNELILYLISNIRETKNKENFLKHKDFYYFIYSC